MYASSSDSFGAPSTNRGAFARSKWHFRDGELSQAQLPLFATVGHLAVPAQVRRMSATKVTRILSSGRLGDSRDADYVDARDEFVQKHNRISRQVGF